MNENPEPTPSRLEEPPEPMLAWFKYSHLPTKLQGFSKPWFELALTVVDTIPRSAERTVALRKLLEGKDAAVRAALGVQS